MVFVLFFCALVFYPNVVVSMSYGSLFCGPIVNSSDHYSFPSSMQMEGVINSNLAELDVTPDVFYEACQVSRDGRDINKRVFEKLLAMEDFTVFKKIMVKRNTELQFEAMQAYKEYAGLSLMGGEEGSACILPARVSNSAKCA